jgi:hypothetical protein
MMKTVVVFLVTLMSVMVGLAAVDGRTKLTDDEAQKLLLSRIQKDKIYGSADSSCLTVFSEGSGSDHVDFSVHLNKGDRCPGNPNASPTVDRFRVYRLTRTIEMNGAGGERIVKRPSQKRRHKE